MAENYRKCLRVWYSIPRFRVSGYGIVPRDPQSSDTVPSLKTMHAGLSPGTAVYKNALIKSEFKEYFLFFFVVVIFLRFSEALLHSSLNGSIL